MKTDDKQALQALAAVNAVLHKGNSIITSLKPLQKGSSCSRDVVEAKPPQQAL
jgi:hypothetical protein